jgi:hypothetical protein
LAFCPPDTSVTLTIPNAAAYSTVSWGLSNPTLNAQFTNVLGAGTYTINLLDSAGLCSTDTTFTVFGTNAATIFDDQLLCQNTFQVSGTVAPGGTWSASSPNVSFSSVSNLNPLITLSAPGNYTISFTDNACQQTLSSVLTLPINPVIFADTALCQLSYQVSGTQVAAPGGYWTYTSSTAQNTLTFGPNNTAANPLITANNSGTYTLTFTDSICNHTTSTQLELYVQPYIHLDSIGCDYNVQINSTISALGGTWGCLDTALNFSDIHANNPSISTDYAGVYNVFFIDSACGTVLTETIEFPPYMYLALLDTNICQGSSFSLDPFYINTAKDTTISAWTLQPTYVPAVTAIWADGNTEDPRIVSNLGNYVYTISNACYSYSDTATIGIKPCDIFAPNIIILSSNTGNHAFYVEYSGLSSFECNILNRWGNVIYSYNDPAGVWNGKTSDGETVTEGTYFYVIKAMFEGGIPIEKHGFVEVKY